MHENEKIMAEKDRINIIHGLIGKWSFWEVYLVERKENDSNFYAMKVVHKSKIMSKIINIILNCLFLMFFTKENNLIKYAKTERNVLSLTNHAFIVKLLWDHWFLPWWRFGSALAERCKDIIMFLIFLIFFILLKKVHWRKSQNWCRQNNFSIGRFT